MEISGKTIAEVYKNGSFQSYRSTVINGNWPKKYFDGLGRKLGYNSMEDWYNVTVEDIHRNRGVTLLNYFHGSPSLALKSVYPSHDWMIWRFKTVPSGYWHKVRGNPFELKQVFDWLGDKLAVKQLNDWYRISLAQIKTLVHINTATEVSSMLKIAYPYHQWNDKLFGRSSRAKASQRQLFHAVQKLFPNHSTVVLISS